MNSGIDPPSSDARHSGSLAVAVDGTASGTSLVGHAADLADRLGIAWEAVHVETPGRDRENSGGLKAAEALKVAASRGATISTIAAATVEDGLREHLSGSPVRHVVMGLRPDRARRRLPRPPDTGDLASRLGLILHLYPLPLSESPESRENATVTPAPALSYLLAILVVAGTLIVASIFRLFVPARSLDLLFLFPVIAVAARHGWRPAVLAGVVGAGLQLFHPRARL